MLSKPLKYYHTLKHLKTKQITARVSMMLRNRIGRKKVNLNGYKKARNLNLIDAIPSLQLYNQNNQFSFLNLSHRFEGGMNWNFPDYGKLWTYNLNYFEFLSQGNISKEEGLELIHDYIHQFGELKDGLEPFPISLRGINWIKFISKHRIEDETINQNLFIQYQLLLQQLEYHLLGNHLLENGFSLLFGAVYFQNKNFYEAGYKILSSELEEQVLGDGAHFELSPMYHQLMLYRILDCINLLENNPFGSSITLNQLKDKAALMLGWLRQISFGDGRIPMLNDSAEGIAPTTPQLEDYAARLGIRRVTHALSESGYRKVETKAYELIMDVGRVGPDYIPGHAHSDTLQFVMCVKGQPFIVDTGISTYEKNERRRTERSTSSHNTVRLEQIEQTEVWGGFRVARRAYPKILKEGANILEATHTGYDRYKLRHSRTFEWNSDGITITDKTEGKGKWMKFAYLHFHPSITPILKGDTISTDSAEIHIDSAFGIEIRDYKFSRGFNKLEVAKKAIIHFNQNLTTRINII